MVYISVLYGEAFPDQAEGAYANYSVYFGVGAAIAYGYSDAICTDIKIYILIGSLLFAMFCYILSVILYKDKKRCVAEEKEDLCENEHIIN